MEELLKKISKLQANAPRLLEALAFQYNLLAQQYIQSEMNPDKSTKQVSARKRKVNSEFNKSNKLNVNSGTRGLAFSFDADSPDTLTSFKITNRGLSGEIGSDLPYANIHEKGGFIKSKGNMHKFFWAMFYQTKKDFFKWIALSVMKKGGVNIEARPYFAPAMKALKEEGQQIIEQYFQEELRELYASK